MNTSRRRAGSRTGRPDRRRSMLTGLLVVVLGLGIGCSGEGGDSRGDLDAARSGSEDGRVSGNAPPTIRPNRPPRARVEVLPSEGYAGMTRFRLDASPSTDDLNLSSEMGKRWDYDGDGTWDTSFSRANRVSHVFPDSGVFHPRLLVRDTGGLVDSVAGPEVAVRGSCPPPDFALVDRNPNSATFGETYRLSDYRGQRVILWLAAPSK